MSDVGRASLLITVQATTAGLARDMLALGGKAQAGAVAAINRAATATRTEAARQIVKVYHVKRAELAPRISLRKASAGNPSAIIAGAGPVLPLSKFKTNPASVPTRKPATTKAAVLRGAGGALPGAFVQRMSSGHIGVFERVRPTELNRAGTNYRIQELTGPSVAQMMGRPEIAAALESTARRTVESEINRQFARWLNAGGN